MDQILQNPDIQMCSKHTKNCIEFLQVSHLQNTKNHNLFYCTQCQSDLSFKGIDYLLTSQIIKEGQTNILQKWPPINDYSVLDKLIQFTQNSNSSSSIINEINSYFTQLKDEFLRKVDLCEKKMINQALELPLGKESILNQYQQISSITQLRTLLIEGQKKNREAHEQDCWNFITKLESQKEKNSELLSKLLKQYDQKDQLVDFEYPKLIKDSIFSFIDQIDFFKTSSTNTNNIINQLNNQGTITSNSSKIMKLISNKSNFCSSEFLTNLQQQLEKINPFLSLISFENMNQKDKNPLDFSALSSERFELIEDFINHQILLEKDQKYSETIEKTFKYQHLEKIIESSVSFLNNNLKGQLKRYIIDSYPLLKSVNFINATIDGNKLDCFRSLTDIEIDDLFQMINKRRILGRENEYNLSQTKQIQEQNPNVFTAFENVDEIFRKYPIFDLMKKTKSQQLIVGLTKTNFSNGKDNMIISEDNQLSLRKENDHYINCVSDIILQKDKKYIFRFSIDNYNCQVFFIGLMENSQCDSVGGYSNKLSCHFFHENGQIQYYGGNGIDKHIKGDKLRLSKGDEIEMRVWLSGEQLEILDYPNYKYQIAIQDQYKHKLTEQNDLKLYLGFFQAGIKITLKSTELVDVFPN